MEQIRNYIDLDSSHRDRNSFPLPSRFDVLIDQQGGVGVQAKDGISNDTIYETGTINATVGAVSSVVLDTPLSISIDDYYNGSIIVFPDETPVPIDAGKPHLDYHTITAYDSSTRTVTFTPAINVGLTAGDEWKMMRAEPFVIDDSPGGGTTTVLPLNVSSSTVDDFYNGKYIYILDTDEARLIIDYDGTTKEATVSPSISAPLGATDIYLIYSFTEDIYNQLSYNGPAAAQRQAITYSIGLTSLIIPNRNIINGSIPQYPVSQIPYFYVEFRNLSIPSYGQISSNNPNARKALFKVPLDDDNITSNFIELKSPMIQSIKFKPNDNFRFAIYTPSGELLTYSDNDTVSPAPPSPLLQISALFSMSIV